MATTGAKTLASGTLRFLDAARAVPVIADIAERPAQIRDLASLFDQGQLVAITDTLIAATGLVHDLTQVTHNTKHDAGVPDLVIDDWAPPSLAEDWFHRTRCQTTTIRPGRWRRGRRRGSYGTHPSHF